MPSLLRARLVRLLLRRYHAARGRRTVKFEGLSLTVERGLFDPKPTFSAPALVWHLRGMGLAVVRAADVGTGTGVIALYMLKSGIADQVIATDVDPRAARAAAENARRNSLDHRMDVVVCDLLSAVRPRSLDLVVSNPPYLPLEPEDELDRLFCAGRDLRVLTRLVAQSAECLRMRGLLVFTASSLTPHAPLAEALVDSGFVYARRHAATTPLDKIYVVEAVLVA